MISSTNHKYPSSLQKDGIKSKVKTLSILSVKDKEIRLEDNKIIHQHFGDTSREIRTYDVNGNLLEQNILPCATCQPNMNPIRLINTYDELNRISKSTTYQFEKFVNATIFNYSVFKSCDSHN